MSTDPNRAVAPLYAIADADTFGVESLPDWFERWQRWGVRCIQVRAKGLTAGQVEMLARRCMTGLRAQTRLWINDYPEVARSVAATGVHLGQEDEQPSVARRALAPGQLIGLSTHDFDQALAAQADPDVDVIAVGPIFETRSKENPEPAVGLQTLRRICSQVHKPVVAIGGIGGDTAPSVIRSGASSVAMIGALRSTDPEQTTRSLVDALRVQPVRRG